MNHHLKGPIMFILPYTQNQSVWLAGNNIVSSSKDDSEKTELTTK
jgi:hypothetical protein|nr:MAG TPA: hypothetical protein [Caudoviricetes sp.]